MIRGPFIQYFVLTFARFDTKSLKIPPDFHVYAAAKRINLSHPSTNTTGKFTHQQHMSRQLAEVPATDKMFWDMVRRPRNIFRANLHRTVSPPWETKAVSAIQSTEAVAVIPFLASKANPAVAIVIRKIVQPDSLGVLAQTAAAVLATWVVLARSVIRAGSTTFLKISNIRNGSTSGKRPKYGWARVSSNAFGCNAHLERRTTSSSRETMPYLQ